jgi:hypothetical protein
VKTHHLTLRGITEWEIGEKDATDDRLGVLVEVLGRHEEARGFKLSSSWVDK